MAEPGEQLVRYARLVAESPVNLVSRAARGEVESRHVPEARAVVAALGVADGERWLDLGTGGGLPGMVLAILRPDVDVVLVDATSRKTREVERFRDELGLANVAVRWGRAEALAREEGLRGAFDGVVARALAPLTPLAELARGFVGPGGRIVAVKGPAWRDEESAMRSAAARLRVHVVGAQRVAGAPTETWLVELRADGDPPEWVPRREGQPQRSPLA